MRVSSVAINAVIVFFLFLVFGCQQEEIQKENTGIVKATPSYLKSFGVPPQGKAGRAYATVGYLPVKEMPGKLSPIPIFLFTEENQLAKVLTKLVSGDLVTSQKQIFYNPFPHDFEIVIKSEESSGLTIDMLTKENWEGDAQSAGIIAVKETALQFNHVQKLKLLLNGSVVPGMPSGGFQRDSNLMIEVPPPLPILMTLAWEKGSKDPKEILIQFDRPVKVETFKLYHLDGQEVQGEYYKSMFQMAVVVHPKSPEVFKEGMTLRTKWSVVDELGRSNSGVDTMKLFKYVNDHVNLPSFAPPALRKFQSLGAG